MLAGSAKFAVVAFDEVVEARKVFGSPDYFLCIVVADIEEYERFQMQKLTALPAVFRINSHQTMKLLKAVNGTGGGIARSAKMRQAGVSPWKPPQRIQHQRVSLCRWSSTPHGTSLNAYCMTSCRRSPTHSEHQFPTTIWGD